LWKVTRSISPEISSVAALRSGIAVCIGDSFSHGRSPVCRREPPALITGVWPAWVESREASQTGARKAAIAKPSPRAESLVAAAVHGPPRHYFCYSGLFTNLNTI
jgi:hypothetical protein